MKRHMDRERGQIITGRYLTHINKHKSMLFCFKVLYNIFLSDDSWTFEDSSPNHKSIVTTAYEI